MFLEARERQTYSVDAAANSLETVPDSQFSDEFLASLKNRLLITILAPLLYSSENLLSLSEHPGSRIRKHPESKCHEIDDGDLQGRQSGVRKNNRDVGQYSSPRQRATRCSLLRRRRRAGLSKVSRERAAWTGGGLTFGLSQVSLN